ncbi:unnamed protein product [Fusarium venenatum]|uniref:Uncharacterized protein n=1 Tax=Fusarium venenatum TaxID=56646 RepID=A0A2L2TGU9_9HYPO|nr:uncharacterized protein FVRRES_06692 [Fusarium venenatum]CEI62256.1 unnamed protein product [Fusarium venenatum]
MGAYFAIKLSTLMPKRRVRNFKDATVFRTSFCIVSGPQTYTPSELVDVISIATLFTTPGKSGRPWSSSNATGISVPFSIPDSSGLETELLFNGMIDTGEAPPV